MPINIYVLCYFLRNLGWTYTLVNEKGDTRIESFQCVEPDGRYNHTLLMPVGDGSGEQIEFNETNVLLMIREQYDRWNPQVIGNTPVIIIESSVYPKLLNDIYGILNRLNKWEENLKDIAAHSHDYQALIDVSDMMTEISMSLTDKNFQFVAYSLERSDKLGYTKQMVENGRLSGRVAAQLMSHPGFEELEEKTDVFEFEDDFYFMAKNIFYEGEYVGRLLLMHEDDVFRNEYHKYILDKVSFYITEMYEREGSFYKSEERMQKLQKLISDALEGYQVAGPAWAQALKELGWELDDGYYLIRFDVIYRLEKRLFAEYLCPQIESSYAGTVAIKWQDTAVVLVNSRIKENSFLKALPYFVRDNLLIAGVSREFTDFMKMKDYYEQAKCAASVGVGQDPHLWRYYFEDYAFDYLKMKCVEQVSAEGLCHPALMKLKTYDQKNHTELYESLRYFIECRYNTTEAAKRAFVHRTTFIKRLEQIQKITHLDLDDWNSMLYVMLSYSLNM